MLYAPHWPGSIWLGSKPFSSQKFLKMCSYDALPTQCLPGPGPHTPKTPTHAQTQQATSNKTKPLLNAKSEKKRDMNEMTMDEGTQAHAVR